ncbi:MAG: hypothetical protein NZL85_04850 [Fimbriimonadales bacterium]|nr:hypothetical protein [Fimbriimonadales bacterium]
MPHQTQPRVVAQFEEGGVALALSPEGRYLAIWFPKPQVLDLQTGRWRSAVFV